MVIPTPENRRGSSGGFVTDLTPERAYDVDLRNLDETERKTAYAGDTRNEKQQNRVEKFLRSARSAGKFRQKKGYDQPYTDRSGQLSGIVEGDDFPYAGSTNYADKPKATFGRF